MLRVVFIGMDLGILDELRTCSVELSGVYLPPSPYWICKRLSLLIRLYPRLLKKWFKTVGLYGGLADFLAKHNILALQSSHVNTPEFLQILAGLKPDLGIVANFGQILGGQLLAIPKYGFINYHPSLLPLYRGPDPLGNILLKGETISGATWHRMTEKIDQGDILAQETFRIEPHDTMSDLGGESLILAVKMLAPLLKDIEQGRAQPRPQNEAEATCHPRLTKEEKKQLGAMGKR